MSSVFDYVQTHDIPLDIFNLLKFDLSINLPKSTKHTWTTTSAPGKYTEVLSNKPESSFCLSSEEASFTFSDFAVSKLVNIYPNLRLFHSTHLRYNVYAEGTGMGPHWDSVHTIFDGDLKGVPIISIVGLLKSAKEGGELIFTDPKNNKQKFLTTEGTFISFPSTFIYSHEVTPVITGSRESFVIWAF